MEKYLVEEVKVQLELVAKPLWNEEPAGLFYDFKHSWTNNENMPYVSR